MFGHTQPPPITRMLAVAQISKFSLGLRCVKEWCALIKMTKNFVTQATKVIFEEKMVSTHDLVAHSVVYQVNNTTYSAHANRDIILSGEWIWVIFL